MSRNRKEEKMARLTFKGGIHPYDGKELSKDKPIRDVLPQGDMVYPLSQHIGAPAIAAVKKGDHVLKGQKIADAGGFVSAPVYASVSGTVKALEKHFNPTGSNVDCIVIENDGEYREAEALPVKPLTEMSRDEVLGVIGEAGIVGMGGAGFPTRVKLSPRSRTKLTILSPTARSVNPILLPITGECWKIRKNWSAECVSSCPCLNMPREFSVWRTIKRTVSKSSRKPSRMNRA